MAGAVITHAVRVAVAVLITAMAASKVLDPAWLLKMDVHWLGTVPSILLGRWLPWLELGLGLLLLCPYVWRPASKICALLLVSFIPVLLIFAFEGRVDCGCSKGLAFLPKWFSHPYFAIPRNMLMAWLLWKSSSVRGIGIKFHL